MSNVIDVDFAARGRPQPGELLDELQRRTRELRQETAELVAAERDLRAWERWDEAQLRRRIRYLEEQLKAERQSQFDDEAVHAAALALVGETAADFPATAIAERLLPRPTHSAIVRVGLALSRLEREGRTERVPQPGSRPNRWRLAAGGGDDA